MMERSPNIDLNLTIEWTVHLRHHRSLAVATQWPAVFAHDGGYARLTLLRVLHKQHWRRSLDPCKIGTTSPFQSALLDRMHLN
jgi:hypothetical protein